MNFCGKKLRKLKLKSRSVTFVRKHCSMMEANKMSDGHLGKIILNTLKKYEDETNQVYIFLYHFENTISILNSNQS